MDPRSLSIAFVVLHTSPLDEPGTKDAGGMNVVVRAQAEELAREGHRVQLITRRSSPEQPAEARLAPNLTAHHLDAGPARLLAKGEHEALIGAFGQALAAHLAEHPAGIVHAEHWYSGLAALPVARALGIPIVQSYHSIAAAEEAPLTEGERPEAPGRLAGERRLAREVDLVVAVSEAERATVVERLGGSPARVRVVAPGVDTEVFRPLAEGEAGGGDARPALVTVGRLHPLKGFDLAIAAVAELLERADPPPERCPVLRIVGDPPPDGDDYVRALHAAVDRAGLDGTVFFDGSQRRDELAETLRRAAIVLIPSHSETFGLVTLEAAASGVPVIARAVGGLREAVRHEATGLLIESDDPAVWADEIEQVLADRELAGRMGRAGRESALTHDWRASAAALLEAYASIEPLAS